MLSLASGPDHPGWYLTATSRRRALPDDSRNLLTGELSPLQQQVANAGDCLPVAGDQFIGTVPCGPEQRAEAGFVSAPLFRRDQHGAVSSLGRLTYGDGCDAHGVVEVTVIGAVAIRRLVDAQLRRRSREVLD